MSNKHAEKEIMDTLLFPVSQEKKIRIYITKEVKNLYNENFKCVKKEIKKHTRI